MQLRTNASRGGGKVKTAPGGSSFFFPPCRSSRLAAALREKLDISVTGTRAGAGIVVERLVLLLVLVTSAALLRWQPWWHCRWW